MNRIFRIIWSKSLRTWVVVSELATSRGKSGRTVDRRTIVSEEALDRDVAEGSPPAAWPLRACIIAALLMANAPAWAASRWWDPNNTSVGIGGGGIWGTSGSLWSTNSDGVSGPFSAWNNAALDDAFFGGAAGTVTLAGAITAHNLTFQTDGYSLTGGSLTLGGANTTISVTTGTTTIASPVTTTTSGLIKTGAGTLWLNGSNNFAGGIDINGGTLGLNAANTVGGNINATGGNLALGAIGDAALGNIGNVINLGNGRSFSSTGAISTNRTINITSGIGFISGAGVGGAHYTGAGGLNVGDGVALTNNANNYQGQTQFTTQPGWSGSSNYFSSIANLGIASALGAPTTVANGTIRIGPGGGQSLGANNLFYTGTGNSSNRNWLLTPGNYAGGAYLFNAGTGTLRLTGEISATTGSHPIGFGAQTADMEVLGVISSTTGRTVVFDSSSGRTIRLGTANTFTGLAQIQGAGKVEAALLANAGVAGSLGAGSIFINGGNLSYVGGGEATNKAWTFSNGSVNNNGTGALTLSGTMAITNTATLGGSFTGADNVVSGVISGAGNLRSAGSGTWTLTGTNTYTGRTIVDSGVLRAGTADAFGASTAAQVNGGTLDLNDFDRSFATLAGTGGTVDLGSATLTLQAAAGTTASYAGNITGSGGLTKLGASTQTLTGANTYTGTTTIGGGVLALDFSPAGGPASNIIGVGSTLNMAGGRLNVVGAAGENNTQTFNGLTVSSGNNTIDAKSGSGGSLTVNLGSIVRTGGLMNFNLPTSGNITTTNTTLGGWATVNGTDYAKVVSGNIVAFTALDYTNKDNAANWLDNEYITDSTGFFNTVTGSKQLAGLRYTVAKSTTVTVNAGQTLGVDGTIIVAPSVLNTNQVITGGKMTGANGGDLGVQQNGTGNFTINSQIVDNGTATGFVKAGTGLVTLGNANNTYSGATRVAQGTLSVGNIGNGGVASGIGSSSAASSNLVLEGATLTYTGGTATSDRGFTIGKSGAILGSGVDVTNAGANLTFGGLVTSSDGANFTKGGAGTLTLSNDNNNYTGITTVTGGLLSVDTLTNGGIASGIGAAGSASANLVLNGGGLQYTGATTAINRGFTLGTSGGSIDVADAATTLTISGTAVGAGGALTKRGSGTLVLSGTNTYNGGTTVTGGTLRAGSTQAFGGTGTMTLANTAGVTLDLNNFDNTISALNGGGANGGNVTLGSATLRIAGGNGSYAGVISGTGGIWRTNGGNQTFSGCNNTYTGVTSLSGSTLSVDCLANGGLASGIGASSNASSNLVFDSGALNYTGGTVTTDRGFRLNSGDSSISVANAGTTLTFSGPAIGGGGLVKSGAGTLVLTGSNTYTGNTTVSGGVLRAGATNAFGPSGHMVLNNTAGALLDLAGFNTTVTSLIGGGTTGGNIALGSGTLTINSVDTRSYAGAISGTGNLVKAGAGTQTLTGCNNSYSGTTSINAGVLEVSCLNNGGVNSSIGASGSTPANLVVNGGTLRYVGAGSSTDRQFTLGTSGGTLDASGTGIVEFTNSGQVALAGANTARTLTLTGTNTGYNVLAAQLDNNGAGVTSLTKTGTGTWRLTNANSSYTGVTRINGGVLSVDQLANGGQASSIGASSSAAANLVIGNGSTLRYTGAGDSTNRQFTLDTGVTYIESSGTGALQFTNTGPVALLGSNATRTIALGGTNTGANIMGGTIGNNGTGATTLAKNDSGTWILTGNNTYTGNTVINNGNLMIGNGGTTGNAGAGNVIVDSATSTLSINRSDTFNFNGTLSGPGTLAQIGTGTTVLTSSGNSIGATTISAGTLEVQGALATPTIAMTGTSGLTVDGTVQAAAGTQTTITGDAGVSTVTVNSGGTLLAKGDLGGGNDILEVSGTLDTGSAALNLGTGDDTLTLHDGATIAGIGITADGAGDELVIDNANPFMLDGTNITGFEQLTKQNTGVLTTSGAQTFSEGVVIEAGTLDVDGTLVTPTVDMSDNTVLNVDGTLEAASGTAATITGSTGSNTLWVNDGATLRADGDLGNGNDTVVLAGTLDTGAGTLGLGDGADQLILQDGASLIGGGVDAGAGSSDQLILDNALALSFDGSQTAGFETLLKTNAGTATMTGSQGFANGTNVAAGELDIDGTLETPFIGLGNGTTLTVDGVVQNAGGTTATLLGMGDNTVRIGAAGTLLANGDLGGGNDVVDVAGTLDTGLGVLALGDGDDTLTIHENTNILGTVVAGNGNDTFNTHIDTVANLGAVQGFETLSKTGTGELNINGPMSSDFTAVDVLEGRVNVTSGGSVVPAPGATLATTVANGATLNVDGSYGCGSVQDSMTVGGTVSGAGTIDLCGGDDTLTLLDGAVLATTISGGAGAADTLVLDNAGALTFDGGNTAGFEILQKNNTGEAIITGAQSFTGGTQVNQGTLTLAGAIETPTLVMGDDTSLNVDGSLQAAGGTATTFTGSAGSNSVVVDGTLLASGDLGAGVDTLDVSGVLDTAGGVFGLGDGDDNFIVRDGATVTGIVDGGAGQDTRTYDIDTSAELGALMNFEGVTKTGAGVLNINGPGSTDLQDVQVLQGTLNVAAGASVGATAGSTLTTTVASGATLNVDGSYGCGDGNDVMDVSGNVSGSGTVDLCGGDDTLTLHDGADLTGLTAAIDGGTGSDTLIADLTGTATLNGATGFETLNKTNTGTLVVAGPASSDFTTVNVDGGTLDVDTAGSLTGVVTTTVAGGATLNVDGSYDGSAGDDTMTVSGNVSGSGSIGFGDGNDTLVLRDGADLGGFTGQLAGGAGGDTVILDNAGDLTFGSGTVTGFEFLDKSNTGTATLIGAQSFSGGTTVAGGELAVDGSLSTPVIQMGDGTSLTVNGLVDAGGAPTAIVGSGGTNEITVGSGATLLAVGDLGGGTDVLDVFGTLDTGGGSLALGGGDDAFIVHDGTVVLGTIDGGAGEDTRVYDINTTADLGALVNFEGVTKTGTGVLNVNGPAATELQDVQVLGGTLNITAGGSVAAAPGSTLSTVVASGATLNVDGSYGCGDSDDTMDVSGTVSGSGTIAMCGGNDTLTLNDGAVLANVVDGGGHGTGDTVVLNNANALTFDASNTINFEYLQKDNTGTAMLTGTQSFSGGTALNGGTLTVAGTLDTPAVVMGDDTTLNVDGALQAAGGTAATITGSAGANTVTVGAGATLLASGDLGDGDDVLDVGGTLDTRGGSFLLGDGDDTLTIHDATNIIGTVVAGAGNDTFNADIATVADLGAVQQFETLSKTGNGALNINGPLSSDFTTVDVLDGALNVTAGGSVTAQTTEVAQGATLDVQGSYSGTSGNDTMTVAGILSGTGTVSLLDGDDTLTLQDGADLSGLSTPLDGGIGSDTLIADIAGSAILGGVTGFETLSKTNTGTLDIAGPAPSDLSTVNVLGGTLNVAAGGSVAAAPGGTLSTVVASGATLNVDGSYGCGDSDDTMDVSGTVSGSGTIAMCGGNDTLTLNDGAVLANVVDGGGHGTGDTVVLNNANALTFDASNTINFEYLQKDNTGTAMLTGTQSFSGGTALNGGTLTVAGTLDTPAVVMGDDTTLNVDGALQAAGGTAATITGSAGANTVTVGAGATLLASGDLGDGDDVLDVGGTLDTRGGSFLLGDGDDTLTIHDATNIIGTVVAGAGNDTFNADIATVADLGAVQQFETLSKTGNGALNINGPLSSDFTTVDVLDGALNVTAGGSVTAQTTTVAQGATLDVQGSYSGTSGDDSFTSSGTVRGAFAFGAGDDRVSFSGGDVSGVTSLGGGSGNDVLGFGNLTLADSDLPSLSAWERVELRDDAQLTLGSELDLQGGVLAIDASSRLFANAGAAIGGDVENAGLIDAGANRFAISGDYTSDEGLLQLTVSPGSRTSGGLNVEGDVIGNTRVAFTGDGSELVGAGDISILVISSPNDNLATEGGFTPDDEFVRLDGSLFPWTFERKADNNWYLSAEAGLLPEIPAYGVLSGLGWLAAQNSDNLVHQRLAGVRGTERPQCGKAQLRSVERASTGVIDDCRGMWIAAAGSETELGANPGFGVSGDDVGLFVGADTAFERPGRTMRGGLFLGYRHGNYWTTGESSTDLPAVGEANIDMGTALGGMYLSQDWDSGSYLNLVLTGLVPHAKIHTADGFTSRVTGNTLTLSSRLGHRFRFNGGWVLEPQVQLAASAVHWGDTVDGAGKELVIDDDVVGTARAAVRFERVMVRGDNSIIRPWVTLGVQKNVGEKQNGASLVQSNGGAVDLPAHELGSSITLDVGLEAMLNKRVSVFGVVSVGEELEGTDFEQREANLGIRVRW